MVRKQAMKIIQTIFLMVGWSLEVVGIVGNDFEEKRRRRMMGQIEGEK
jgi:hypothetical protein